MKSNFKRDLTKLAELIVEEALEGGTPLDTRIQALKAVTALHLGDSRIRAMLKAKGVIDDEEAPAPVIDFKQIRNRVHAVE